VPLRGQAPAWAPLPRQAERRASERRVLVRLAAQRRPAPERLARERLLQLARGLLGLSPAES
jgi:hypothetical protein